MVKSISAKEKFRRNFERLVRFDKIRASKLLEMIQSGITIFVLCLVIGHYSDQLFPLLDTNCSNTKLAFHFVLQLILNIILVYYVKKISEVIPFLFSLTDKYVSDAKGEQLQGAVLVISIIFYRVQKSFQQKLNLIIDRFTSK